MNGRRKRAVRIRLECFLVTARNEVGARLKFHLASVILLTEGGASSQGGRMLPPWGVFPPGGCFLLGDASSGGAGGDTHPPPGRLLLRAVRILLECSLVTF